MCVYVVWGVWGGMCDMCSGTSSGFPAGLHTCARVPL